MLKVLLCILGVFGVSLALLQVRQERLGMRHEVNRLHDQIEGSQGKLWNQQLEIARATTPAALKEQMKDRQPQPKDPYSPGPWMDRREFPEKNP